MPAAAQTLDQALNPNVISRLVKTELCRYARTGCRNGTACPFAHSKGELRQRPDFSKTSLCKEFALGRCSRPAHACPFAHGEDQLRRRTRKGACKRGVEKKLTGSDEERATYASETSTNAPAAEDSPRPTDRLSWDPSTTMEEVFDSPCHSVSNQSSWSHKADIADPLMTPIMSANDWEFAAAAMEVAPRTATMLRMGAPAQPQRFGAAAPPSPVNVMAMAQPVPQPDAWPEDVLPLIEYLLPSSRGIVDRREAAFMLQRSVPDVYEE